MKPPKRLFGKREPGPPDARWLEFLFGFAVEHGHLTDEDVDRFAADPAGTHAEFMYWLGTYARTFAANTAGEERLLPGDTYEWKFPDEEGEPFTLCSIHMDGRMWVTVTFPIGKGLKIVFRPEDLRDTGDN